jgi:hypothetical protein
LKAGGSSQEAEGRGAEEQGSRGAGEEKTIARMPIAFFDSQLPIPFLFCFHQNGLDKNSLQRENDKIAMSKDTTTSTRARRSKFWC